MAYPKRAFIFSSSIAFVPHPYHMGVWFNVHPCVLLVDCPDVGCKAKAQQLCRQYKTGEPVHYSHWMRRKAAHGLNVVAPSIVMLRKDWRKL